jgi:hypothetical protein
MNIGDIVMIKNQEQYEKMAVKIIEINDDNYTVKVLKNDVELIVKIEDLKRKKMCLSSSERHRLA